MGIAVDENGVVTFTSQIEQLVDTSTTSNPNKYKLNGLVIHSVFKRLYKRDGGDGNHLIYALKAQKGFSISLKECGKFNPNISTILDCLLEKKSYSIILTMPSSHKVVERFGLKIKRRTSIESILITDIFTKKTFGEVYNDLQKIELTPKNKKTIIDLCRSIEKDVKRNPNKHFSMKNIATKDRKFIQPLKINDTEMNKIQGIKGKSILLVDDLLATGTTLTSAHRILKELNISQDIEGICLLGKVGNS